MRKWLLAALVIGLFPGLAWAHGVGRAGGFLAGMRHPVLGYDHLLAMISVGILSAQIGGRAIWTVPTAFVLTMAVGGLLGILGVPVFSVEIGIAFSVFALGAAIAADKKMPVVVAMLFVATFAIFHGHAHGTEMPELAAPVFYAAGFMTGTAGIHVAGVLIGMLLIESRRGTVALRLAGAAMAAMGLALIVMHAMPEQV
ncbi:MAG: HupE/UreJ family protein [Phycisphaeraceae bacterium]|nr:HupE/UreJ family protein [Phycisphaeraceae bacterium]